MKVIIAGSRHFTNYELLKEKCDQILQNQSNIEIVSGTCRGADKLGEQYAQEKGYTITQFPADWDKHKNSAGHIRNKQMAEYADALIAFCSETSKGTQDMINLANKNGLKVRVIKI